MKKIFFLPILLVVLLSFAGCEKDESLDPRPLFVQGQFMRLDITKPKIDINNLETSSFGGMLTNPSNDVVRYELFVRLFRASRSPQGSDPGDPGYNGDFVLYDNFTGFPQELSIKGQKVIEAYAAANVEVSVKNGDEFYFIGYSYDAQGNRIAFRDLSLTVRSEAGYKQAYKFNTIVTDKLDDFYNNYAP